MNLFKKPKYLLMILLASFTFVTFVPQFVEAQHVPLIPNQDPIEQAEQRTEAAKVENIIPKVDPDAVITWLATQLGHIVYFFTIKLPSIILLLEIKMFNVVGVYNGFTSQPQVVAAWVTVRDLANMFFILILLLMAFGTILQVQGFGYRQLLSKLLLMAILINFSKSIVALLIDFSQIITLTFLAPVLENLAGNYVVALGLQNIMNIKEGVVGTFTGITYLMAMILGGIMMIITTVVMGVILIMFVLRIISFWILIILAPMAFLARAFPKTSSYYGQWETELSKNLTTGPALAFFVWLAFSIVGQGNIATYFPEDATAPDGTTYVTETKTYDTVVSEVADTANMLNFVIAITLLMAGLKFAASSGAAGASVAGKASGSLQKWGSRIGRGATIGAAAGATGFVAGAARGATRLAWQGTSGEGGAKGIIGQTRGFAGRGLAVTGEALGIGAMQRKGLTLQAKESDRRQRKQEKYNKRLEGMSDEQREQHNLSVVKGVGFMGKREAKASLAIADLSGKAVIDPKRADEMQKAFLAAGDYKSLEKLRSRSMAINSIESLDKQLAETGDLRFISKMNPAGMSPEQGKWLLNQDPKMLSTAIEAMSKEQQKEMMSTFRVLSDSGKLSGDLIDDKSAEFRASILRSRFDGGKVDEAYTDPDTKKIHATLAERYAALGNPSDPNDPVRRKFIEELRKSISGEQILKIDNNSQLYNDMVGQANAGQRAQMKDKATDAQMETIVTNNIRFGNIAMTMKDSVLGPVAQAGHMPDIDQFFKDALGKITTSAEKMALANKHTEYGHKVFAGDKAGLYTWAKTLKPEDLLKIDDKQTIEDIAINAGLSDAMRDALYQKGYGNKSGSTPTASASGGASTSGTGSRGRP